MVKPLPKPKKTMNSAKKKRKAVTKKSRAVSAVPGATDGAIVVFCAYGCGISYTTYPRNVNRPHWHKTLRKLNAHESQRCPRNEDRKRRCRKNSKIRISSTANAPVKKNASSVVITRDLGPGAPSVAPDNAASPVTSSVRASIRRHSRILAATIANAAPGSQRSGPASTAQNARQAATQPARPPLPPKSVHAPSRTGPARDVLNPAAMRKTHNDSFSSLGADNFEGLASLMTSILESPMTDVELEDQELLDRLGRELTPGISPLEEATGVYWTEPSGATARERASAEAGVRSMVEAEQRQRQSPEESWRCGAALTFTRQVFPEFSTKLQRHIRRNSSKVSLVEQRRRALAQANEFSDATLSDNFGTIHAPAILTTMHLRWGIGQEVPVTHEGQIHRGNIVAIGGERGSAALVQFFDRDGQMMQQLHRTDAPVEIGFTRHSWIADVKAPQDSVSASEAIAKALASLETTSGATTRQRRPSGPNQRIVSVFSRAPSKGAARGCTASLKSGGGSGGRPSRASSTASQDQLEAFPDLNDSDHSSHQTADNDEDDDDDADSFADDEVKDEPLSLAAALGSKDFSEFDGADLPDFGDAALSDTLARRASSLSLLFDTDETQAFELARAAHDFFAAEGSADAAQQQQPVFPMPSANASTHTKRSRRGSVRGVRPSPKTTTANLVNNLRRVFDDARRLSGMKLPRRHSLNSVGSDDSLNGMLDSPALDNPGLGSDVLQGIDLAALELEESTRGNDSIF